MQPLVTLGSDLFDTRTVATGTGMAGSAVWIGGMQFTFAIGKSAEMFGYNPLFVALAALDLLAAGVLWSLVRARASGSHRGA